jgi:hypothetical protein
MSREGQMDVRAAVVAANHGYGFIDVSGLGNSGKSALVDVLREFDEVWAPEFSFEFDLLRMPGGLIELKRWLCDDWSPIRSHAALRAFEELVERTGLDPHWWDVPGMLRSTSHRYDRRFQGRFRALSHRFAESFVLGRYRAEWSYDSLRDSDLQRFRRRLLRKLGWRRPGLREVLLVDGAQFAERATRYLQELYSLAVDREVRFIVLNNGLEPFNPVPGLDLILGARQVVVTRDPRDVYVSGRNADRVAKQDRALLASDNDGMNKSFLATDDLRQFVQRYRLYHHKLYRGSDARVMHVRFEDLVGDYETTLGRVRRFLGLQQARQPRARQCFAPDRSAGNVGLWRRYGAPAEIEYIERELRPYLVEQ